MDVGQQGGVIKNGPRGASARPVGPVCPSYWQVPGDLVTPRPDAQIYASAETRSRIRIDGRRKEFPVRNPPRRQASVERITKETRITGTVSLDGTGAYDVSTGIGFLDHMLEQLSRHSLIDIALRAEGDLHIDFHHTTEDTGYVIGEAVSKALGDRRGITRFGSAT